MTSPPLFAMLDAIHHSFRSIFGTSIGIFSKVAKNYGSTSSVVYLPRRYTGCPVTLIIWPKDSLSSSFPSVPLRRPVGRPVDGVIPDMIIPPTDATIRPEGRPDEVI